MQDKKVWGQLSDGRETHLYTLTHPSGIQVTLSDYGARIVALTVKDGDGEDVDVVLGYDTPKDYEQADGYLGAVVGRVGNRLGGGMFRLHDHEYTIKKNEGDNTLHGGPVGFDQAVWEAEQQDASTLVFRHVSEDGDQGFPGTLTAEVTYRLTEDQQLMIHYRATTDQDTPVNLTNHAYFNLNGDSESVEGHRVMLEADYYTPVDDAMLPDGTIAAAEGPFDWREGRTIADAVRADHPQIDIAGGVDHNFVLRKEERGELSLAAAVRADKRNLMMTCYTTQPGVQFYTGNALTERTGKKGQTITKRSGLCLETQHFPHALVRTHFPDIVLRAGEELDETTIYGFLSGDQFEMLMSLIEDVGAM